jgi:hypothetical protein
MTVGWQDLATLMLVLAAASYLGRGFVLRLTRNPKSSAGCATGCSSCPVKAGAAPRADAFVQIGFRDGSGQRDRH